MNEDIKNTFLKYQKETYLKENEYLGEEAEMRYNKDIEPHIKDACEHGDKDTEHRIEED